MAIGHGRLLKIRWLWLLMLVVVPLFMMPGLFRQLKAAGVQQNNGIENCVTFTYTGGREVAWYTHFPEEADALRYVFLPSYADMEHIVVETGAYQVEFVKDGERITVRAEEPAICAFETYAVYEMYAYDAAGQEIGSRRVTFWKSGKLPVMYVTTQTGSMELLDADKAYKEDGWVEFLDVEGKVVFTDELRSISARGNQTFHYEKKSYQIRTHNSVDIMGMGTSDTWILLSNAYDLSLIRNKLTYDMALQAGMHGSPKSEYIDVYFNGVYGGMYQLCEKVEIGENRLEIADLEEANRALNGELDYADTFVTEDGMKGTPLAREPEDITGGYLLERDYDWKFDEVVSGFVTDDGDQYSLQNPAHASEAQVDYIAGLMQEIEDAIRTEDGINPRTGKHFTEYIDLESWADKYLVEEITRNDGGGASSSYFYKPQDAISTKVYAGPVWDYDKGYGGNHYQYDKSTRDLAFLTLHHQCTRWFYYLYQHEEFVEAVKREYKEKFADYLTVMSEEKIDEYLSQIEDAALLDRARFGHDYQYQGIVENAMDYRGQAEQVRTYIREHKAFLDEVWLEDAEVCKVQLKNEDGKGNYWCFGVKAGECLQALPVDAKDGMVFLGWKIEGTEEYLTTETPIWENTTVYATFGTQ